MFQIEEFIAFPAKVVGGEHSADPLLNTARELLLEVVRQLSRESRISQAPTSHVT